MFTWRHYHHGLLLLLLVLLGVLLTLWLLLLAILDTCGHDSTLTTLIIRANRLASKPRLLLLHLLLLFISVLLDYRCLVFLLVNSGPAVLYPLRLVVILVLVATLSAIILVTTLLLASSLIIMVIASLGLGDLIALLLHTVRLLSRL